MSHSFFRCYLYTVGHRVARPFSLKVDAWATYKYSRAQKKVTVPTPVTTLTQVTPASASLTSTLSTTKPANDQQQPKIRTKQQSKNNNHQLPPPPTTPIPPPPPQNSWNYLPPTHLRRSPGPRAERHPMLCNGRLVVERRQHRWQALRPQLLDKSVYIRARERRHGLAANRGALHHHGALHLENTRTKSNKKQSEETKKKTLVFDVDKPKN